MTSIALTFVCLVETFLVVVVYFVSVLITNYIIPSRDAYEIFTQIGLWFFLIPLLSALGGGWLRSRGREDQAYALCAGLAAFGLLALAAIYLIFHGYSGGGLSG